MSTTDTDIPMLTDDQKLRIRAEELYRLELRRELESPTKKSASESRLWALLNTSFVLWFLSSVVVAGLTAGFASYRSSYEEEALRGRSQKRIEVELGHRVNHAATTLEQMRVNVNRGGAYLASTVNTRVITFLNNAARNDQGEREDISVFPEYRDRTFRSLVVELGTLVDSSAHADLRDALSGLEIIADRAGLRDADDRDTTDRTVSPQESLASIAQAQDLFNRSFDRPRWHLSLLKKN